MVNTEKRKKQIEEMKDTTRDVSTGERVNRMLSLGYQDYKLLHDVKRNCCVFQPILPIKVVPRSVVSWSQIPVYG